MKDKKKAEMIKALPKVDLNNTPIPNVSQAIYLGGEINYEGDEMKDVKRRIALGYTANGAYIRLYKSKKVSIGTKLRTLQATFIPIITYGCESWHLTEKIVDAHNSTGRSTLLDFLFRPWKN